MDEPSSVVIRTEPDWFEMTDPDNPDYRIGYGREITSRALAQLKANIFEFEGWQPDLVHRHKESEETYWVQEGSGPVELWLNGNTLQLEAGARVIIPPGDWHATRPIRTDSHILIVASPPFSEADQEFMNPQPKGWLK